MLTKYCTRDITFNCTALYLYSWLYNYTTILYKYDCSLVHCMFVLWHKHYLCIFLCKYTFVVVFQRKAARLAKCFLLGVSFSITFLLLFPFNDYTWLFLYHKANNTLLLLSSNPWGQISKLLQGGVTTKSYFQFSCALIFSYILNISGFWVSST